MSALPFLPVLLLRRFRAIALAGFGLLAAVALQAQTTGTVAGRITDAKTRLVLGGARVSVTGSGLSTYADPAGEYVLTGVPAGANTLEFGYVGYADERKAVNVTAGTTTTLDVAFGGDIVALDKFVIRGSVVGSARAINQQRAAETLTNIVASDEIGSFPDQNAAEAIQRIPGISLYRDQGEGRYIVLRGLNYNYTSVKVNGGAFAGADLGDRATPLDVIPSDALASIKVTKVPTPDMDGEGLGGQVDIKTKSAFDAEGFAASFTAQGQYSSLTEDFSSKFNGHVSHRFGADGRYGIMISPSWQERKFGSHNFETGGAWTSPADNRTPFYTAQALEFRDYVINRERSGLNAALELRPDSGTSLYLRGGYNRFTDTESRHLTIFDFNEGTLSLPSVTADSATYTGLRRFGRRLRIREKDQEVYTITTGGEKRFGSWTVDALAGYTEGNEKRPNELVARFRRNTRDATIRYKTSGPYGLSVEQLAGASFFEPGSYNFQRVDLANESGSETESNFGFNARYDLGRDARYVKFGTLFRAKEKDSEGEVYELTSAPASFTFANLAEPASDYRFLRVPRISTSAVQQAFYGNRAAFTGERVFEDSEFEDFSLSEDVSAAYVMAGGNFGRLNLIAGARVERTEFDTTGKVLDLVRETATPARASRRYTNWLPGVYARYDLTKNFVLRASWSNALARPSFGETAFRSLVNADDLVLTRGNPALAALEAESWDASAELYLPSLGVLSAAVFRKDIRNFSYEFKDPTPVVLNGQAYELTTFANGSKGRITGLELAYQQQLRQLPAPFDGLGFMANITLLDSQAKYPTRPGEKIPFVGQSDQTGNLGLSYEKRGLFLRLALNFRTERLREDEPIGGSRPQDLWVDDHKQLDLTARYQIGRHWEVFGEVLNLTDEPFRVFLKNDNAQAFRLGQVEEYGWSANFGVRWTL